MAQALLAHRGEFLRITHFLHVDRRDLLGVGIFNCATEAVWNGEGTLGLASREGISDVLWYVRAGYEAKKNRRNTTTTLCRRTGDGRE